MTFNRDLVLLTGFIFVLTVTQSWGQVPNPTDSDGNANTAGGTGALFNVDETVTGGFSNTAFGSGALGNLSTGSFNTAYGARASRSTTPVATTVRSAIGL
jgi:hypothetical protein